VGGRLSDAFFWSGPENPRASYFKGLVEMAAGQPDAAARSLRVAADSSTDLIALAARVELDRLAARAER
jgi:hypothetical protein